MTVTVRQTRPTVLAGLLVWLSVACGGHQPSPVTAKAAPLDSAGVLSLLSALADDSMQGRGTATPVADGDVPTWNPGGRP